MQAARQALEAGQYKEALQHCKASLKAAKAEGRSCYEPFLLVGRAATGLAEFSQAELAYRKALELEPTGREAWQGLADLMVTTGNYALQAEACEKLLEALPPGDAARRRVMRELAEALAAAGQYEKAVGRLCEVLADAGLLRETRLELLCKMADLQIRLDDAQTAAEVEARLAAASTESSDRPPPDRTTSSLQLEVAAAQAAADEAAGSQPTAHTLLEVVALAPRAERYGCYQEEWLKRLLLRIFAAPPRSVERQQHRLAALRACRDLVFRCCCSPLPYEAAMWLLEEEEEIKGGLASVGGQVVGSSCGLAGGVHLGGEGHIGRGQYAVLWAFENFARRMVHQFPTNPTARVCLGLMLRRRACGDGMRPIPQAQRREMEALLRCAMADAAQNDCATGWKALAELQYENRDYGAAGDTAVKGLAWLHSRRERGHEALTQCALGLRLVLAKALRRMGRLDEAERHFKVLAGWVTEGEAAFAEMSGSASVSIHQQALRGLALVDLQRGDRQSAKAQYERILGAAALGRGAAEHWAHADYGWLLFQDSDLHSAREHLEQAIRVSMSAGAYATDSQLAEHYYRLGEVYWRMRGRYRTERQFAYSHLLEAAKVEGHAQAAAFAALGRYFQEVESKADQAARCYKKALALDPGTELAGGVSVTGLLDALRAEAGGGVASPKTPLSPSSLVAGLRMDDSANKEVEPSRA